MVLLKRSTDGEAEVIAHSQLLQIGIVACHCVELIAGTAMGGISNSRVGENLCHGERGSRIEDALKV